MTLDEAIKYVEELVDGHNIIKQIKAVTLEECKRAGERRQIVEWLKDYKRLLEQEPILDKIRDELHATAEMHEDRNYYLRDEWVDEIIDKYKSESEK